MNKTKLDPKPARTNLTSREVTKLLGAFLGGVVLMSDDDSVRTAVRWWAELSDEDWRALWASIRQSSATIGLTRKDSGTSQGHGP